MRCNKNKEMFVEKTKITTNPDLTEQQIVDKLKQLLNKTKKDI